MIINKFDMWHAEHLSPPQSLPYLNLHAQISTTLIPLSIVHREMG